MAQAQIIITAITAQAKEAIDRLNRSLDNVESSTKKAGNGLGNLSNTAKMAAGAFAALTAGIGIKEIVDITGRFTDLNSRLINATGSAELAADAFEGIKNSARTTYQPLEQTAEVFLRNSVALNELGYTTNEQIKISTALGNAMAVSGAKGQRAASALDGFQKAIAGGKMQGEDFNRIMDNAPQLIEAMAKSLGVTTQQFRQMVKEGKITSDVMIPALLEQFDALEKKAEAMPATMSDGFTRINNSFFEFIGKMDQALNVSETLAQGLIYLSDNIHIVVGAIGALAIAASTFLIPFIGAFALLAAKVAVILALGAAVGIVAKKMGLFAFMAEKAVDPLKEQAKLANDAAKAEERKAEAARKAIEAQQQGLKDLFAKIKLEGDSIGLSEQELALKKNIAEAAKILKIDESEITKEVRERIEVETLGLIQKKQESDLIKILKDLETERFGLAIQDKDQKEIALSIRKLELEFGRALNTSERERLTTAIQQTQQAREQVAIAEALTDATRQQTELEKIQRGIRLQSQLNPASDLKKQFDRDLAALETYHAATNTATAEALEQRKALNEQYQYRLLQLQNEDLQNYDRINKLKQQMDLARIEKSLMAEKSGMAKVLSEQDRAVLQRAGQEERQTAMVRTRIEFEKKSEMEKVQFGIQQGAELFSALGAQNKKAFEAAKAFNIANAIMNTYMAATKALATYPPPFNFIAAAAAVGMGLAQVAQIRAQQYSGRALGGPVMGGQTYMVGESGPELFTPSTTGSITRNSDLGGQNVNVTFNINAVDAQGVDDLLLQRRGLITQLISDAMTDRGQRSML